MTNQEGMWAIVLLIGLIFLVGIPLIIASFSACIYALSGILENRKVRFAAFSLTAIGVLSIMMLMPEGWKYYLGMLPFAALGILVACGHGATFIVFEDRFSAVRGYVLLFISAALCSAVTFFAWISIVSIPAYSQVLGRLQYILYLTLSLIVPTILFTLASKLWRRPA